jgi:hypothetical protein
MIVQVRAARPSISMGGKDYFSALEPYFLTMSYTDNCDGAKADDFQLQLADRDRRFINDWRPDLGSTLDVAIIAERWFEPFASALSLDCGRFWIDSMEFELPQHTVTVKATSIPTEAHLKVNNETRGWEKTTLEEIVNQIAKENNMEVDYQAGTNPNYRRVEQNQESALQFLQRRTEDAKLAIKIHRNKIVIFDEETIEAAAPKFALVYGNAQASGGLAAYRLEAAHFIFTVTDTQKKATVSHLNPDTGKNMQQVFDSGITAPSRGSLIQGQNRQWDQKVTIHPEETDDNDNAGDEDGADGSGGFRYIAPRAEGPNRDWNDPSAGGSGGQRRAKSEVRRANKEREHAQIKLGQGNPLVAAGQTCTLSGFGQFDGKWFVLSAEHTIGEEGYNTTLLIRRCLEGY